MQIRKSYTNRESESINKYFREIGKTELLTPEEEVVVIKRIKEGTDTEKQLASDKLVTAHLRFVVSVAKQYQNQGLSLGDLINEGNIGMIKAIKKFDRTRGLQFISYAVWWIKQAILASLAKNKRTVRLPLNRILMLGKISRTKNKLEQELQRLPTDMEIAERIEETSDLFKKDVINTLEHGSLSSSLDRPLFNKNNESSTKTTQIDRVKSHAPLPDTELIKEDLSFEVEKVLDRLKPREATILRLFFGIGQPAKSLREIGEELDLTGERVRQIKEEALKKLRRPMVADNLKDFLG